MGGMTTGHFFEDLHRQSGSLSAAPISALLGLCLPGPRPIHLHGLLRIQAPVRTVRTVAAVFGSTDLKPAGKRATLRTRRLVKEEVVIEGEACVLVRFRL